MVEVKLAETEGLGWKFYPNPVQDRVTFSLQGDPNQTVGIHIYASNGALMRNFRATLTAGTTEVPFSLANLEAGVYVVAVVDPYGRRIGNSQQLIKK